MDSSENNNSNEHETPIDGAQQQQQQPIQTGEDDQNTTDTPAETGAPIPTDATNVNNENSDGDGTANNNNNSNNANEDENNLEQEPSAAENEPVLETDDDTSKLSDTNNNNNNNNTNSSTEENSTPQDGTTSSPTVDSSGEQNSTTQVENDSTLQQQAEIEAQPEDEDEQKQQDEEPQKADELEEEKEHRQQQQEGEAQEQTLPGNEETQANLPTDENGDIGDEQREEEATSQETTKPGTTEDEPVESVDQDGNGEKGEVPVAEINEDDNNKPADESDDTQPIEESGDEPADIVNVNEEPSGVDTNDQDQHDGDEKIAAESSEADQTHNLAVDGPTQQDQQSTVSEQESNGNHEPIEDRIWSAEGQEGNIPFESTQESVHSLRDEIPPFYCEKIASNLNAWVGKKYEGGYRSKQTGYEYFHASTQTITAQERRSQRGTLKFHRDTQTKLLRNRISQSYAQASTQMTKHDLYVSTEEDYLIRPRRYVTAEEHAAFMLRTVIKLQCFFRKCFAIKQVNEKKAEKKARSMALAAKEKRRRELAEKRRKREVESRLHPKTGKDFEILYNGLENWRIQETAKINAAGFSEPARLTALADLLDQEASLIQKIDRLKIVASEENRELSIIKLLDKMSSPKKWPVSSKSGGYCSVDTPNTIRARELRDLYHALNIPLLSVDERLQILLHVKYTVKEFDCNLTRDIVELIDREGDLVSRGREAKSLEGLRRRISNLFLQFIQTPEFNPESKLHQKFPEAGQSWKKEQSVYYCRGCTKYLSSTEFYLSTTMRHLGRCKACTMKENIANQRKDDTCYVEMLKMARGQEVSKAKEAPTSGLQSEGHYNALSLLQESDVRYLVDIIWNRQSAVSGNKNIEELVLTRWDPNQELSPWNVILLTVNEATSHDNQPDPLQVYSDEFVRRVQQRHMAAKHHFSQLSYMEKYLNAHYQEAHDGKLVSRGGTEKKPQSKELAPDLSITGFVVGSSQQLSTAATQ